MRLLQVNKIKTSLDLYSNLILNGNALNQGNKDYISNKTFYGNNKGSQDKSKESIVSENELPLQKLINNSQKKMKILNANKTHSGKKFLGKVNNKTTSNMSSKLKINSQFFGQRNSKSKKKKESLKPHQNLISDEKDFSKMKLNQVVDQDQHLKARRQEYGAINSHKIRSNTYGSKACENTKGRIFGFRDHNQNKDFNKKVRNSRISTTYGSGSNRTNISTGMLRNNNYVFSETNNTEARKVVNNNLERCETQDSFLNNKKNSMSEVIEQKI